MAHSCRHDLFRYERYEGNQVQADGAVRTSPPSPVPVSQGTSSGEQSMSLVDFSSSELIQRIYRELTDKDMMKDDDAENLAEWLGEKMIESEDNITQEFDQFLAERAEANEKR